MLTVPKTVNIGGNNDGPSHKPVKKIKLYVMSLAKSQT